ncbi:MAG: Tat (twin-arginine translocation) pathway signal sequence containing protein [Bacteroidota bacterium]
MKEKIPNTRRNFISAMAMGVTASSLSILTNPLYANDNRFFPTQLDDADDWFKNIKGKHRIVYDGAMPNNGLPVIWNWAYYETNNQTGSKDKDITALTVFRHGSIGLAFDDSIWEKYQLGAVLKITDTLTQKSSIRNLYYEPKPGDFPLPGIQGVKQLQARGALFCVCDLATKKLTRTLAEKMNQNPADVYTEWINHLLPGIQLVPSGVWALGRAQEHGCGYIYAG